jgi:hypothetical protein
MSREEERLQLALRIAIDELKKHLYCGDCFPEEGWPSVHQVFIDINLAREGKHPFQKKAREE